MTFLQILLFLIFVLKIAALAGVMQNPGDGRAETASVKTQNDARPVNISPGLPKEKNEESEGVRMLLTALEEKQKVLDKREAALKTEEQRLLALKKEITDKMAALKAEQEKLYADLEKVDGADAKKYKDLAKVYDSTPPAKAGAMLEAMDLKTAALITMNMKKDKAGAIWGYLTPQKAVEITREITGKGVSRP